jgi:hypothetical protein
MSSADRLVGVLLFVGMMLWQLASGRAFGPWWRPTVERDNAPRSYWLRLVTQAAVLLAFLLMAKD